MSLFLQVLGDLAKDQECFHPSCEEMQLELLVAVIKLIVSSDPPQKKKRRIRKRSAVRERLASLPNANNNALGRREDLCLQEAYLPWDLLGALSQDHICV